jgi:tetratricopeptide (TPR) repeat protein
MNTPSLLLLTLGIAAGASVATTIALRSEPALAQSAEDVAPEELRALRTQVQALGAQLERLSQQSSAAQGLPRAASSERVDMEQIDRAVARYLDQHLGGLASTELAQADRAATSQPEADVQELLDQLADASLDEEGREALWQRIRDSGRLDDAIALLEARAEKFSDDPDAQVEVASAYIQKIFEVGEGPQAGIWAGKADKAYDRALVLDERHWDARFNKAVSLSFWPPIFGKQREAISHFETLIGQQERGPGEERFVQTYVLLGNLYAQAGDSEKAEATWKKGLGLYPGNASLLAKFGQ